MYALPPCIAVHFFNSVWPVFLSPLDTLTLILCYVDWTNSVPVVWFSADEWGLGKKRSFSKYLEMVGIDILSKTMKPNQWCHRGEWPQIAAPYRVDK